MDKWGAVNTKLTKEGTSSRTTVAVCVLAGVLIASGLFVAGMWALDPILDEYISNKPISQLYDFYDLKVGETETAVYFIGNSQIGSDVYVPLIVNELRQRGYPNLTLYNLYQSSDKPLRRLSQVEDIISSKPSLIIYGVSSWIFTNDEGWVDEDVLLVHDRLHLNSSAQKFYSDDELQDSSQDGDYFFLKRFLLSALMDKGMGLSEKIDPITYTTEKIWDAWTSVEKRTSYSNVFGVNGCDLIEYVEITETHANTSRNKIPLEPFTFKETRNLLAFNYILNRFSEEGIPVVLVIMPEHSIVNDLTPAFSETNLRTYLNTTGLPWYDLDEQYDDEIMADLTHANWDGVIQLVPSWADIIIEEVKSGAVHYA